MMNSLSGLIAAVCVQPEGSPRRQRALNRLLLALQQLPGLKRSGHPLYREAQNQTWEWVCRNIDKWQEPSAGLSGPPNSGAEEVEGWLAEQLTRWINGYLGYRIRDLYTRYGSQDLSLDAPIGGDTQGDSWLDRLTQEGFDVPTLAGLEVYVEQAQRDKTQRLGLQLEFYIEQDPTSKLQGCYPKGQPECHAQELAQRLLLTDPPEKLAAIAREFGLKEDTLRSHWKRKVLPLLQEIAKSFGYQSEQDDD